MRASFDVRRADIAVCRNHGSERSIASSRSRCSRLSGTRPIAAALTFPSKDFTAGYFGVIDSVLNSTGVACFQVITIPEARFEAYQREVDFIRKWIFPGGFLPTVSFVTESIRVGAKNRLVIDSVSNIGVRGHVLRSSNVDDSFDSLITHAHCASGVGDSSQTLTGSRTLSAQSILKWTMRRSKCSKGNGSVSARPVRASLTAADYFCYCEVGFSERVLGDHIFTIVSCPVSRLTATGARRVLGLRVHHV